MKASEVCNTLLRHAALDLSFKGNEHDLQTIIYYTSSCVSEVSADGVDTFQ